MYIADLHIHSRYSRATSKDCTPEHLDLWARRKGIHIVGSGDFTHPAWREELGEKLEPAEDGLYTLKKAYRIEDNTVADAMRPRFVITGEISSIYKKNGKVRKVHSLILLPGLEDAERISHKLEAIGNIHSDGRPILGLDCHDLLEILLELCPNAIYVPAHIWTPHFSLFGAFSGFDSVEECYGDLTPYIHAMETGLSSDPPMIWRVSALDRYQLISNSDAHSPAKLGREANLLDTELSYQGLSQAIQTGQGLLGTIEFFPEEGKYHFDGHRKCNLCLNPRETADYQGICPVCGRKLTIGVSHRIEQLADRAEGYQREGANMFESLMPLAEAIGASTGRSPSGAKVQKEYLHMLRELGSEFDILREIPLEEIQRVSGHRVAQGIGRLRTGQVTKIPGFDGEYGRIQLYAQEELSGMDGQISLFASMPKSQGMEDETDGGVSQTAKSPGKEPGQGAERTAEAGAAMHPGKGTAAAFVPNEQQQKAIQSTARIIAVAAGPGTGKTRTLSSHILYLLETRRVKPSQITAVTFTNQAVEELRTRIQGQVGNGRGAKQMQIGTFHSIALNCLKSQGEPFTLAGEMEMRDVAERIIREFHLKIGIQKFLTQVSRRKTGLALEESENLAAIEAYQKELNDMQALDFDDLLIAALQLAESREGSGQFAYLLVDEFQDISPLQYQLIKAWNKDGRELFVIGDENQAIYGFRGADSRCFRRLVEEFPQTQTIALTENYRSTPQILTLASAVISRNPGSVHPLAATVSDGIPVRLLAADSGRSEAICVAKEVNRLTGGIGMLEAQEIIPGAGDRVLGFDDIAVLYRTHRQGELLENCLRREGIPFVVAGRDDFLTEPEVRGTICFFQSLIDPENRLAGQIASKLLWNLDKGNMTDMVYNGMVEKYGLNLKKKRPRKILEEWEKDLALEESEAMDKLIKTAVFYRTMEEFLQALELGVESDLKRVGGKQYTSGAVTLMTLHGSKGLEYPAVILYGVRKGRIPIDAGEVDVEEERRLFYVGITRAKEELILTTSREESEFLQGLPEGLLVREQAFRRKKEQEGRQMSLFDFPLL